MSNEPTDSPQQLKDADASIRHPLHIIEMAKAGADIATVPFKVLELAAKHTLTDKAIERFLADSQEFTAVTQESHKTRGIS